MQITGKCKIANKFINDRIDKNQFEFENKGKLGVGKLSWTDTAKDKNGQKIFKTSTKKFICFGANIDFIEQNIDKALEIEGNLVSESFKGQDGKIVRYDQIIVNKVEWFVEKPSKHQQDKSNGYQPQPEEDGFIDDEIKF